MTTDLLESAKTAVTLTENSIAPDFKLPANGDKVISLAELKGKKVVLYFYPKDNTPGCTQESKDFRDLNEAFTAANTVILGVSKDGVNSHNRFVESLGLPFDLVADTDIEIIQSYGVWKEKSMFGKKYLGVERSTFLINEQGKIQKIWHKVKVKGHAEEVLAAAKS